MRHRKPCYISRKVPSSRPTEPRTSTHATVRDSSTGRFLVVARRLYYGARLTVPVLILLGHY